MTRPHTSLGLKARAKAYLDAAKAVRAIDAREVPEAERIADVIAVLTALAARAELFPLHAFPRAEGTPGGLFRLAAYPDQRGAIYMSLGYVGRKQTPHNHVSWAAVVGVSGGTETNVVYERVEGDVPGEARLIRRSETAVGPGGAVALPSGFYHTIEVSSGPSLHLHAYSWAVDAPGFETFGFDSPEATSFVGRPTGGFKPPLSVVTAEDIAHDLVAGDVALVALDGAIPVGLAGPYALSVTADEAAGALKAAGVGHETPVVLAGGSALETAIALYEAGYPLVFEHRAADARRAAA